MIKDLIKVANANTTCSFYNSKKIYCRSISDMFDILYFGY